MRSDGNALLNSQVRQTWPPAQADVLLRLTSSITGVIVIRGYIGYCDMSITRREFGLIAGATLMACSRANASQGEASPISIVLAPSNLGMVPTPDGGQSGTWRGPQGLLEAGLDRALDAAEVVSLERPTYEFGAQAGTRIRNGNTLRASSIQLSDRVRNILQRQRFPVVIGGDNSVLLGSLYGLRLAVGRGLVHLGGYTDFSHPNNYDTMKFLGAAAGMELALASGRGEPLLTHWPVVGIPLADDADIIQVGERGAGSPGFMSSYGDFLRTEITQLTVQCVLADGVEIAAGQVVARLAARGLDKVWLFVDLDVLDQAVMSAVDTPGSPGFNYDQLSTFVDALRASGRIAGASFSIYDPDRDPGAQQAGRLVRCIADGLRGRGSASSRS